MTKKSVSNVAALIAVIIAFLVGIIGSLAVRPNITNHPGKLPESPNASEKNATRFDWYMPVTAQTSLPVVGDHPVYLSDTLATASNGALRLRVSEPGEIVPPFSIMDAVRDGKVPAGLTWLGYDQGKIPASPLLAAVPFGLEPWGYTAWWFNAGGRELAEELYKKFNIHPILCGMIGPETAGWFRSEITSLEDIKGLKIRFAGLGGRVLEKLGASVTMLPPGEIFQALEKGALDATEYSLPIIDQSLGFNRVAKYNYFPGWHQPFSASHLIINLDRWNGLSPQDQALLEVSCTAAITRNLAHAEATQGPIVKAFNDLGVVAGVLPEPLLRELQQASHEVMAEEASRDKDFAEILASQKAFRDHYAEWKTRAYLPRNF